MHTIKPEQNQLKIRVLSNEDVIQDKIAIYKTWF